MKQQLRIHPAADRFPMMSEERLSELADDIRENGLSDPIVLIDGAILDGRNRARACDLAGVEPRFVQFGGENPFRFVWSQNGQRRDLEEGQRAAIKILLERDARAHDKITTNRERRLKISEATKDRPRREDGKLEASCGSRDPQLDDKPAKDRHRESATERRMHAVEKHSPELLEKVARGEVKPMQAVREVKRAGLSDHIAALPAGTFRVIYADPPWKYGDDRSGLEKADTAAAAQYPLMPTSDICALTGSDGRTVRELAQKDAVLFMWATFPLLEDGLAVMKAWGFDYKTAFVWDKERSNIGNYHDARAELLMIGVRGSCPIEINTRPKQVQVIARGKHSAKPESFRELIDLMYPTGPRVELFRRGEAPKGWVIWGNESEVAA